MSKQINVILALKDQFTSPITKATSKMKNSEREVKRLQNSMKKLTTGFVNFGKTAAKVGFVAIGAGMALLGNQSVELAKKQLIAETKLATILRQRTGATDEQIKSVLKLTSAQQALGVIGDEVQIAGAQQLGTFVNSTEALEAMIPAMNNLLAQQKGLNATQEDAVNVGNLMGKVMTGQTGALKRVGISFSKAQEKVLKYGTEAEKAAMLAQVITENVGEMNAALAKTDEGRIQQFQNSFGDFKEEIGKKLLPILGKMALFFSEKMPQIQAFTLSAMDKMSLAFDKLSGYYTLIKPHLNTVVDGLSDVYDKAKLTYQYIKDNWSTIGPLVLTLVGAITTYKAVMLAQAVATKAAALGSVFYNAVTKGGTLAMNAATIAQWAWNAALTANPIGLVIAAIAALVAGLILLVKNWDWVKEKAAALWETLKKGAEDFINWFTGAFQVIGDTIDAALKAIGIDKDKTVTINTKGGKGGNNKGGGSNNPRSNMPKNAQGTNNWRGGLTSINERGGEIVDLPQGTRIYPHDKSVQMARKEGKKINININIQNLIGDDALADRVGGIIARKVAMAISNI